MPPTSWGRAVGRGASLQAPHAKRDVWKRGDIKIDGRERYIKDGWVRERYRDEWIREIKEEKKDFIREMKNGKTI